MNTDDIERFVKHLPVLRGNRLYVYAPRTVAVLAVGLFKMRKEEFLEQLCRWSIEAGGDIKGPCLVLTPAQVDIAAAFIEECRQKKEEVV